MNLPIDIVPNTNPPKFKWRNAVHTMNGTATQDCEGMLPPSCERAVEDLISVTKQALKDNAMLRGQVEAMTKKNEPIPQRIAETLTTAPAPIKKK